MIFSYLKYSTVLSLTGAYCRGVGILGAAVNMKYKLEVSLKILIHILFIKRVIAPSLRQFFASDLCDWGLQKVCQAYMHTGSSFERTAQL